MSPALTSSQNCTTGEAPGFPNVAWPSLPYRHGKERLACWNRQAKSTNALVTLSLGPKFGGSTAAMPSRFPKVQSIVIESPFPSGFDASICRSGLPSGNAGGVLSRIPGARPLPPKFGTPSTAIRKRLLDCTKIRRPNASAKGVGVGPGHTHPGVLGQGKHPWLSATPRNVITGPASLVVGFGVAVAVAVGVSVRVGDTVNDGVGVPVGV